MMTEFTSKKGNFVIRFESFQGAGWRWDVKNIIESKIQPVSLVQRDIEISINGCEVEFIIEKDSIQFVVHFDDTGPNAIKLLPDFITNENKQKLRDWAKIIAEEVEKLKNNQT